MKINLKKILKNFINLFYYEHKVYSRNEKALIIQSIPISVMSFQEPISQFVFSRSFIE